MVAKPTILIADRESDGLSAYSEKLDLQFDCTVLHSFGEEELRSSLAKNSVDILVIDLNFSADHEGIAFISSLTTEFPKTVILPIIPIGRPHLIKQLLALDLFYFIHKPIDPIETRIALKRVYETLTLADKQKNVVRKSKPSSFHGMIGSTKIMQHLFDMIARVADDDVSTVLIRGESGTGKEMIAKAIHAVSRRRDKNFVPVNCAAIPDDLLESELFGYTKGAFTGAIANKQGRIQYADQGTLFLDEIGDMKASLQAKLLRVIQEKEFEPVGALKSIPVNTRILAATHCDLEKLVNEGTFREDLYYRLSVIPLNIPSLKERSADIPLLIDAFLEKYTRQRGRERFTFAPEAMAAITHYKWRGNVRELENLVQHMSVLFTGKTVYLQDLPEKFHSVIIPAEKTIEELHGHRRQPVQPMEDGPPSLHPVAWQEGQIDFNELINDFETQLIVQAMKLSDGNKKEAARILKLKRTTLLEKIKKKDIEGLWEK
jgi:DNA-binding NtrC family response regulator